MDFFAVNNSTIDPVWPPVPSTELPARRCYFTMHHKIESEKIEIGVWGGPSNAPVGGISRSNQLPAARVKSLAASAPVRGKVRLRWPIGAKVQASDCGGGPRWAGDTCQARQSQSFGTAATSVVTPSAAAPTGRPTPIGTKTVI